MVHSLLAVLALSSLTSPTRYVDPMIGTGGTGHTFPGVVLPHGMVQLSPDTGIDGWEHSSGYYYSDRSIMGFSHLHLSGTGVTDQGDILVMPTVGGQKLVPGDLSKPGSGYRSRFSHSREVARAGYYSVFLQDPGVQAELTATSRVGIHRYTFPRTDKANLTFDITHYLGGQTVTLASARWISSTELQGSVFTDGWAHDQHTYFVARFSQPATRYGVAVNNAMEAGKTQAEGKFQNLDAYATFDARQNPVVLVKVALSNVSTEGARLNLNAEATHWDFERYVREANAAWRKRYLRRRSTAGRTCKSAFITRRGIMLRFIPAFIKMSMAAIWAWIAKFISRPKAPSIITFIRCGTPIAPSIPCFN